MKVHSAHGLRLLLLASPCVLGACLPSRGSVFSPTSPSSPGSGFESSAPEPGFAITSNRNDPSARPTASPTRVVHASFDVVRADLPVDSIRHSLKVWNHVDEGRLGDEITTMLSRNGIRAGVASPGAWAAIRTIVESCDATLRREDLQPAPGVPLVISMGVMPEPQPIFSYSGGRLAGKTFPASEKCVALDYAFHSASGGPCDLRLVFELRRDRGEVAWEPRGGTFQQVAGFDRDEFTDLQFALSLEPREILVIGPSEKADNAYLVGSRFFGAPVFGQRSETVLLVTPRCYESSPDRRSSS